MAEETKPEGEEKKASNPPTREQYQERLDKIASIFSGMVQHADAVSLTRCPYKNRHDQCTAKFGCRHQVRSEGVDTIDCKSDDALDYRTAWETDPDAEARMHEKLKSRRSS